MHFVCLGLLLFGLAWAAPTFQPQTEKTMQDYVEEQRQGGRNRDNIVLHHFGKKRIQGPTPRKVFVQRKEEDVSLLGIHENNQSSKFPRFFENRETMSEDYTINNNKNHYNDLNMSIHPESTESMEVEEGDHMISTLHEQEEYSASFIRNNIKHLTEPVTVTELLRGYNKEEKPNNVPSKIPTDANIPSTDEKKHQRAPHTQNTPVKSKSIHHSQPNIDYLKQPKVKKIPSDFEGSSYPDLHSRGDNDISPFSGDGQPFEDIFGKGETIDPDVEGTDIQTEFSVPDEGEINNMDTRGPGYNELPGKEGNDRNNIKIKDKTIKEGSNDIMGITNFKELPGIEGNRMDGNSQNAHQGQVEFHYPRTPSKEKNKEGGAITKSTNYNEIQEKGKGSSRKGIEHSSSSQETSSDELRFPSKGKSQDLLTPSHGLDSEIKNEMSSHNNANIEGTIITPRRKGHYIPRRQNTSMANTGAPQRKGSWSHRKPHANKFSFPRKRDSSESSDSDSSSESEGE